MIEEEFKSLVGKTLTRVEKTDKTIEFWTCMGEHFRLYHSQDCCETVEVEDVCGDMSDLLGVPILLAEETQSGEHPEGADKTDPEGEFTWTFYKLATIKGSVTIRFFWRVQWLL